MSPSETFAWPHVAPVRQQLYAAALSDVPAAVRAAADGLPALARVRPGQTVAVAVGSRGIDRLDRVVGACIDLLKKRGLKPVIVPAMGSHGGATAEGQAAVLARLGITPDTVGAPLDADMRTVRLETTDDGVRLFFSRAALAADHLVVINRVKPHTKFSAPIESGLCKMLTVGLGKHDGAAELHRCAVTRTFGLVENAAARVLTHCKLLFGLALLEDGLGKLARIEALPAAVLIPREKELLVDAAAWMGRIPFDHLDVLVVDWIGKDVSGIGMDSNVTGRHRDLVGDFNTAPHVKRIFVRNLTPASNGNASGIGLADVTTRRLVDAMDRAKTYVNALTAISPEKAAIPIYFDSDREGLAACLQTAGLADPTTARLVRLHDTKTLDRFYVSRALEAEVAAHPALERVGAWAPPVFDTRGNLSDTAA